MDEKQLDNLRAAGISDDVIKELMEQSKSKSTVGVPDQPGTSGLPMVDPTTPSQAFSQAQAANVPTMGSSPGMAQTAMEVGKVATAAALPAAVGYGIGKFGGRAADVAKNFMNTGAMPGPVSPTAMPPATPAPSNIQMPQNVGAGPRTPAAQTTMQQMRTGAVPSAAPAAQEAQQISKANQIVRSLALDKLLKGASVPAAVGLGGAAATGLAASQMRAMSPEQRRSFYENPMLGAMGGDAALGAAIMNQGQ